MLCLVEFIYKQNQQNCPDMVSAILFRPQCILSVSYNHNTNGMDHSVFCPLKLSYVELSTNGEIILCSFVQSIMYSI